MRATARQISFADWELMQQRDQGIRLEPLLEAISGFLDDQRDVIESVRQDLVAWPRNTAKHPHGPSAPNGLLDASIESWQIKLWWQRAPLANLGVRTDKLVVVDVDPRHGGDESFAALVREHGEMPLTWRALTGGGGEHILFAAPDGVEISNVVAEQMAEPPLGPGVDIRALHGYIVAPPSVHVSGRPYAWSVDHHPADVELARRSDQRPQEPPPDPVSV